MGWVILFALIGTSFGLFWLLRVRDGLLTAALAALMLGAAGYALQGRPSLSGSLAQGSGGGEVQSLAAARHMFFGNFSAAEHWLVMSEALARDGQTEDAVGLLQNAVRRYPADPQLWVGLANALVDHAHGMTPPAEFAYRRATQLLPGHPAPRFFYDLALARSGAGGPAVKDMAALMQENPKASWREMVGYTMLAIIMNGDTAKQPRSR